MENENKPKSKIVQTYAEDMVHVLEDDKGGLIKKIIQGEEQSEKEKRNLSPQSKKNKIFLFLGFAMILISFGILIFFFLKKEPAIVPIRQQIAPIIFTDKNSIIEVSDLTKDEIAKKVHGEVQKNTVKIGGIESIYMTLYKAPVDFKKFIEIIEGNFATEDQTAINNNFLMGVMKNGDIKNPQNDFFMILKVRSIPDVFTSMRTWENKMFADLHGFFGIDFSPTSKYLITKSFQNGIVENKNARILYDTENKIVMMYVFVDDNSIVITDSENTVREIMLRLGSSLIKK